MPERILLWVLTFVAVIFAIWFLARLAGAA
jgi:hypothetical protein